jgi:hypothetical protein
VVGAITLVFARAILTRRGLRWFEVGVEDVGDGGAEEAVGGAARDFVVGVFADDGEEARDSRVLGLGVEGLAALGGDVADVVEQCGDVGLGGPEGEVEDVGVAGLGEFGETEVAGEPGLEAVFVLVGEF